MQNSVILIFSLISSDVNITIFWMMSEKWTRNDKLVTVIFVKSDDK